VIHVKHFEIAGFVGIVFDQRGDFSRKLRALVGRQRHAQEFGGIRIDELGKIAATCFATSTSSASDGRDPRMTWPC
jgi:hypothetical protein